MRYHTGHRPERAGKQNLNENTPPCCSLPTVCFGSLSLPSSWLVFRPAFFYVLLLSISWTHHKTGRTTSKQTASFSPQDSACSQGGMFAFVHVFVYVYVFVFYYLPVLIAFLILLSINSYCTSTRYLV